MDDDIKTTAEASEAAAMPRCREVHSDKDAVVQNEVPEALLKKASKKSQAEWAYERLILFIQNFEKMLENSEEIAMGFTDTGGGFLKIEGLGHFDPDIVTFYGTDQTGAKVQLVQHVSQLNVLLRAMPKENEAEEPRRIGFRLAQGLDESAEE